MNNMKELFDGLNNLCETNEAFYHTEQKHGKYIVRSYTYRLASWTDFQEPFAKDARGTAFIKDTETGEWTLFCRAYRKFHNLGEGIPLEDYISKYKPLASFEKLDGSLIIIGRIDGKLVAKSKTSLNSKQAEMSQEFIDNNESYTNMCHDMIDKGETPVFEGIGSKNVIVLRYNVDFELRFLGSVNMETVKVSSVSCKESEKRFTSLYPGVKFAKYYDYTWDELLEIQKNSKPDIEGFVVKTTDGFVKVKVQTYKNLHHAKDSINNIKALIGLILSDDVDDLIGLFRDDQLTVEYIQKVQEAVSHRSNHLVIEYKELRRKYFQDFNENRKEFAMKYRKHPLFTGVMRNLKSSFRDVEQIAEKEVKIYIEMQCKNLKSAEIFMKDLLS